MLYILVDTSITSRAVWGAMTGWLEDMLRALSAQHGPVDGGVVLIPYARAAHIETDAESEQDLVAALHALRCDGTVRRLDLALATVSELAANDASATGRVDPSLSRTLVLASGVPTDDHARPDDVAWRAALPAFDDARSGGAALRVIGCSRFIDDQTLQALDASARRCEYVDPKQFAIELLGRSSAPAPVFLAPDVRRLPIYLLLDISGSMKGAAIEAVRQGLYQFKQDLVQDAYSRDCVSVCVIAMSDTVQMLTPGLVHLADFQPPDLIARDPNVLRLDLAFEEVHRAIQSEVNRPSESGVPSDYLPLVFVFTGGGPTDEHGEPSTNWTAPRDALLRTTPRVKDIVAVGCGPGPADADLKAISTGTAVHMGYSDLTFSGLICFLD